MRNALLRLAWWWELLKLSPVIIRISYRAVFIWKAPLLTKSDAREFFRQHALWEAKEFNRVGNSYAARWKLEGPPLSLEEFLSEDPEADFVPKIYRPGGF